MQKKEILKRYIRELVWDLKPLITFSEANYKKIDGLIDSNYDQLVIWLDNQLTRIEEAWEVTLTDLFAHCNWNEERQNDFVVSLLGVCSGLDGFPEDEFEVRKDLHGARSYFDKPLLPERAIIIDVFDGYLKEFLQQFDPS